MHGFSLISSVAILLSAQGRHLCSCLNYCSGSRCWSIACQWHPVAPHPQRQPSTYLSATVMWLHRTAQGEFFWGEPRRMLTLEVWWWKTFLLCFVERQLMIHPDPVVRPSAAALTKHPLLRPSLGKAAQLQEQLNVEKFKTAMLERWSLALSNSKERCVNCVQCGLDINSYLGGRTYSSCYLHLYLNFIPWCLYHPQPL